MYEILDNLLISRCNVVNADLAFIQHEEKALMNVDLCDEWGIRNTWVDWHDLADVTCPLDTLKVRHVRINDNHLVVEEKNENLFTSRIFRCQF